MTPRPASAANPGTSSEAPGSDPGQVQRSARRLASGVLTALACVIPRFPTVGMVGLKVTTR